MGITGVQAITQYKISKADVYALVQTELQKVVALKLVTGMQDDPDDASYYIVSVS